METYFLTVSFHSNKVLLINESWDSDPSENPVSRVLPYPSQFP